MQEPVGHASEPHASPALSAVPAAGIGRSRFAGGTVKFFYGPMDCGNRPWRCSWITITPGRAATVCC